MTHPQCSADTEPVAWRVKNDFGHWYVTQDKALADTYRATENKDVQPLYRAAQPPTAPVETDAQAWHGVQDAIDAWAQKTLGEDAGVIMSWSDRLAQHLAPALPRLSAGTDPVAWRCRPLGANALAWQYSFEKPDGPSIHLFEVQPLYLDAQPPTAPVETGKMRQEPIAVRDACDCNEVAGGQPPATPVEPYAWVIPGDDQSRPNGSIDAMAWREGEFTKPLYAQPPAAGMSRADAESLVFDLLDAVRSFAQAETAFRRGAREYYEEMRDKVIAALVTFER